jgi:hypothetical protein
MAVLTSRLEVRHVDGWWLIVAHDPATASSVVVGQERLARDALAAARGAAHWLPVPVIHALDDRES